MNFHVPICARYSLWKCANTRVQEHCGSKRPNLGKDTLQFALESLHSLRFLVGHVVTTLVRPRVCARYSCWKCANTRVQWVYSLWIGNAHMNA